MSDTNTSFEYEYRDAGNYKHAAVVVVAGILHPEDLKLCLENVSEGTEFIPSQVGLEDLQPLMKNYPSSDDHVWHQLSLDSFQTVNRPPTVRITARELIEKFKTMAGHWDVMAACKKHGFIV